MAAARTGGRGADPGAAQPQRLAPTSSRRSSSSSARSPRPRGPPSARSAGASRTGRAAVRSAADTVELLANFAKGTPELAQEPRRSSSSTSTTATTRPSTTRAPPRPPAARPTGYTGLEALLAYIYDQTLSVEHLRLDAATSSRSRRSRRTARSTPTCTSSSPRRRWQRSAAPRSARTWLGINMPRPDRAPRLRRRRGGSPAAQAPHRKPSQPAAAGRSAASPSSSTRARRSSRRPGRPPERSRCRTLPGLPDLPDIPLTPAAKAPRLPPRAMNRRPAQSLVANPVLVGAVTTLVVVVAVFLAYNANSGLPFVPTKQLNVQISNGANLVQGNEVRSGGFRIGVVERHGAGEAARRQGRRAAQAQARQEGRRRPGGHDACRIRPRSALGLKYVEFTRGKLGAHAARRRDAARAADVDAGRARRVLQHLRRGDPRRNSQENLQGFGDAFAGRGTDLNRTIQARPAASFGSLTPVTRNLADPRHRARGLLQGARRRGEGPSRRCPRRRRGCSPRWPTPSRPSAATRRR